MRYDLIDYQREAAIHVLNRLARGRRDWMEHRSLSAFALSAVTGAGKTVIATAVIEAMIHGSPELGFDADTKASFLWVTDDPALNRQTRNKMLAASDVLHPSLLVVLDNDFTEPLLQGGRVYFLNIQKLSKSSGLAQGGNNVRQYSMWEIIANTIASEDTDLYVVLDEAHKGMKPAADRTTIVQRIIGGQRNSNPPAPVVWGISATIERFISAMAGAADRTTYPHVQIDIEKVRASGLVKDQIVLDEPGEKGTFASTLLREAVDALLDYQKRWASYAAAENEPLVLPVLVVQVPDKVTEAQLSEIISIIASQWRDLPSDAIVNVFGEHETMLVGGRTVRWVQPESIQEDASIRVVLAKQAISTGWDCPRAEVLYSERPASDATHIAQVIGRMIRSPLARRIPTDDALNSVACFLPRFQRGALTKIAAELTAPGEPGTAVEIIVNAQLFIRNPHIHDHVSNLIESLPSVPPPDVLANPLRRARSLAKLLTDDGVAGGALLADAGERLTRVLNAKLDGLAAEHALAVAAGVQNIETASIQRTVITPGGEVLGSGTRTIPTAPRDIDRDTRRVLRTTKEGVGLEYFRYRVAKGGRHADAISIRTEIASLFRIDNVIAEVENAATKWVQERFAQYAVEIKNTTGATRDAYQKVKEQAASSEVVNVELKTTLRSQTKESNDENASDLPTFVGHIYSDAQGRFPTKLNEWERMVVETETRRPSFIAWYRNPARATPSALRIAYKDEADEWRSLQVDFIVVSRRDDGTLAASLVDPHGDHLADAKAKLLALVDYAERFGERYVRIDSIAQATNGALRCLSLTEANVRQAVREFEGSRVSALYDSPVARDYL